MDGLSWPYKKVRLVAYYLFSSGIVGLVNKLQMAETPQDGPGLIGPEDDIPEGK